MNLLKLNKKYALNKVTPLIEEMHYDSFSAFKVFITLATKLPQVCDGQVRLRKNSTQPWIAMTQGCFFPSQWMAVRLEKKPNKIKRKCSFRLMNAVKHFLWVLSNIFENQIEQAVSPVQLFSLKMDERSCCGENENIYRIWSASLTLWRIPCILDVVPVGFQWPWLETARSSKQNGDINDPN